MNILYILKLRAVTLFLIAFLNFGLASILFYNATKDENNKDNKAKLWLGFWAIASSFYAFFCGATYFFWGYNNDFSLFWYKTTWLGIFILPSYVIFSYYFTNNTKYLWLKSSVMYIVAFVIIYFVFTTDLFIRYIKLEGFNIVSINGDLDIIGRGYIFFCLIIATYNLLKEYFHASGYRKVQLDYFILGTSLFAISGAITTSIIPLIIKESPYYDVVAYFSFVWVALTSYAILKHRLFDIKILVSRVLVFFIWVFVAIRIVLSSDSQELFINISLAILVLIAGILLLRSMSKENELTSRLLEETKKSLDLEKKLREKISKKTGEMIKKMEDIVKE